MVVLEAVGALALLGLVVYGALRMLSRPALPLQPGVLPGRWRVAHFDVAGTTRVVVQKVTDDGLQILDEHMVDAVPTTDPDYDARFLAAMSAARERRALFESEDEA